MKPMSDSHNSANCTQNSPRRTLDQPAARSCSGVSSFAGLGAAFAGRGLSFPPRPGGGGGGSGAAAGAGAAAAASGLGEVGSAPQSAGDATFGGGGGGSGPVLGGGVPG